MPTASIQQGLNKREHYSAVAAASPKPKPGNRGWHSSQHPAGTQRDITHAEARSMSSIHCHYSGDLHCQAQHLASGAQLSTDAPLDHAGRGEGFAPTDLLATAVGTCLLTVMGIAAKQRGWDMSGARADVEKTMVTSGERQIKTLRIAIELPMTLPPEQVEVLRAIAKDCPVLRSLHPDLDLQLDWLESRPPEALNQGSTLPA